MLNCFVFFTVGAAPDQADKNTTTTTTNPGASGLTPEPEDPITPEDPSQNPSGGKDDPQEGSSSPTTTTTTTTTTAPSSTSASTITNTVADPVYTSTTVPPTYQYDEHGFAITDAADTTAPKTTKKGEKITEPTTVAKIVTDYSKQYNWLKWVSLVGMILSLGGLIVLNVMYKSLPSKSKRK